MFDSSPAHQIFEVLYEKTPVSAGKDQTDGFIKGLLNVRRVIDYANKDRGLLENNALALIRPLMRALIELRDAGEINLTPSDMAHYIQPMNLVTLVDHQALSGETRDEIYGFLHLFGWKADEPDPKNWGDFDRTYTYAQNYFLDLINYMNQAYGLLLSAAEVIVPADTEEPATRPELVVKKRDTESEMKAGQVIDILAKVEDQLSRLNIKSHKCPTCVDEIMSARRILSVEIEYDNVVPPATLEAEVYGEALKRIQHVHDALTRNGAPDEVMYQMDGALLMMRSLSSQAEVASLHYTK